MLYSKTIVLDREYEIKFGIRETLTLKENNLDLSKVDEGEIGTVISLLLLGIKRNAPEMTRDMLIDLIDESPHSIKEIVVILMQAIELGLNKKVTDRTTKMIESIENGEEDPNA